MIGAQGESGVEELRIDVIAGLGVNGMGEAHDHGGLVLEGMFVVAIPRVAAAQHVGEGLGGIKRGTKDLVAEGPGMAVHERIRDVTVDGIFADQEQGADDGG